MFVRMRSLTCVCVPLFGCEEQDKETEHEMLGRRRGGVSENGASGGQKKVVVEEEDGNIGCTKAGRGSL